MQELLGTPGMIAALIAVLVLQAVSLLVLFINIEIFRSQSEKYRLLLSNLGDQSAWGRPGRVLIPLYIILVLCATVVTTLIFLFQPHVL